MGSLLLALREMRRGTGRFGLLTGAVGVLVFLIVFQQALTGGLITEFVGAIRNQDADVLVYGDDARVNLQGSVVAPEAVSAMFEVDGVASAGPLGVATVSLAHDGSLTDATVFGHQLGGPGAPASVSSGRRSEGDGEAVASANATGVSFALGDRVVVEPGGEEIEIVGLADDISFSVTPSLFVSYATYEAVQLAANPDAPGVVPSAVAVRVESGADAGSVADAITAAVPGVEAVTRAEAADRAPGVAEVGQSFGLILLLTYVVATIVIGFFFLILTVQKRPTLTLLRALGAPTRRLLGSLAVQVAAVVGGGFVVGSLLAVLALGAGGSGIEASVEASSLLFTAVVLVVLAAVACIGVVRRIVRIDPVEATLPGATR